MDSRTLREPRSRLRQGSSELPRLQSDNAPLRGSLQIQPTSTGSADSPKESGKLGSFTVDASVDHTIITMQTRVAIRDETPHRFQVIPLRDVSKLETSSAGHRENASRLPLSATPKQKALWLPPKKPGANSQSKLVPSASSLKLNLDTRSNENAVECDGDSIEMDSNREKESLVSSLLVSSPSVPARNKAITLAQLDTNHIERRRPLTSSAEANACSTALIHELIRSESPLTHTISRSLQVRTRQERNYPKFASTGHGQPPAMPLLVGKPKSKIRSRTMTEADLLSRYANDSGPEDESYYALLDAYDSVDPKLKKRHAIYTPTLYIPNFDQSSQLRGCDHTLLTDTIRETTHAKFQASCGPSDKAKLKADISKPNSEAILHHCSSDINDEDVNLLSHLPKDTSNTRTNGIMPISTPTQHLTHKSSSQSLRLRPLSEGLSCAKIPLGQGSSATFNLPLVQDIVYPQIILDLLSDTDEAIVEWKHIY